MDDLFSTEEILERSGGFFCSKTKITVKNRRMFSMIDSPGVKETINMILDDPTQINHLTNKGNSMFVLTDGTGFQGYSKSSWNNDYGYIANYSEKNLGCYKTQL